MKNMVLWLVMYFLAGCGSGEAGFDRDAHGDAGGDPSQGDGVADGMEDPIPSDDEGAGDVPLRDGADAAGDDMPVDVPGDREETEGPAVCTPIPGTGCGSEEICDDGLDNDCDGQVDEECLCDPGATAPCFRGMPAHRGVGGCMDGTHICPTGGEFPLWLECEGGITESEEVCDGKDNDCNGCVDDIPECYPTVFCPSDDTAAPLHWYDLDGDAIYAGTPTSWLWTISPPSGSLTTDAECPTCKNTRMWIDLSGDWLVHVQFVDELGRGWTCDFIVHVRGEGIRVEMWWNEGVGGDETDVDLHLHRNPPAGEYFNGDDCYFSNCDNYTWGYSIDWGYPITPAAACPSPAPSGSDYSTGCPNPRLDLDDVDGNGPENINIDNPGDGDSFRVMVHFWDDEGREGLPAPTNVRIYCGGVIKATYGPASIYSEGYGTGDIWRVADIVWDASISDCAVTAITGSGGSYDIRPDDSRYSF
jgi:hypothetical protein